MLTYWISEISGLRIPQGVFNFAIWGGKLAYRKSPDHMLCFLPQAHLDYSPWLILCRHLGQFLRLLAFEYFSDMDLGSCVQHQHLNQHL